MIAGATYRPRRIAVAAALVAVLSAACSAAAEEPTGFDATPSSEPTPTPESTPSGEPTEAADIAALEALYLDYWDAFVDVSNDPRVDPAIFAGLTTDSFAEQKLSYVDRELISNDVRREGEPELTDVTVTVDGDTATVEACLDESPWKVLHDGDEVSWEFGDPVPAPMTAERTDEGWVLTGDIDREEATITC